MSGTPSSPASMYASPQPAPKAHAAMVLLSLAPLLVHINTNFNIVATAAVAVYAGSWRSVKPTPPSETMTKKEAMRFPLVGSAVLFGLFLCFKFLPKELVNALLSCESCGSWERGRQGCVGAMPSAKISAPRSQHRYLGPADLSHATCMRGRNPCLSLTSVPAFTSIAGGLGRAAGLGPCASLEQAPEPRRSPCCMARARMLSCQAFLPHCVIPQCTWASSRCWCSRPQSRRLSRTTFRSTCAARSCRCLHSRSRECGQVQGSGLGLLPGALEAW